MSARICSVVTTYRPSRDVIWNLAALRRQTDGFVVVDNGSPRECILLLQEASIDIGFQLILNGKNLGIAAALNKGVRWAIEHKYPWIALFDQDSVVTDGFLSTMMSCYHDAPEPERIAILFPTYRDKETHTERHIGYRAADGGPLMCMTSGSLMRAELFDEIGFFSEELFIYCVDDEFCLRARRHGYQLMLVRDAVLLHKEGASYVRKVLGFNFYVTNQAAKKRYYIMRNQLWVHCRYPRTFPAEGGRMQNLLRIMKIALRVLALEGDKLAKVVAMTRGAADYSRNRMGKTIEL